MAEAEISATTRRTAELFAWLNEVKTESEKRLPASAFKVAFELGQYVNRAEFARSGSLIAWPSLERIAAGIAMGERTARDMVKRLAETGHLMVCPGHGPGNPSRYRLIIKNRQAAAALVEAEAAEDRRFARNEKRQQAAANGNENRQDAAHKPAGYDTKTGSRLPTNHSINSNEPSDAVALGSLGEALRSRIGPDKFRAWFGAAEFVGDVADDVVTIALPSPFFRNHVAQTFEFDTLECCRQLHPDTKSVRFIVAEAA